MKEFINKLIGALEEESYEIQLVGAILASTKTVIELPEVNKIVTKLAEEYKEKDYCWQTCANTEHCKLCNRLGNGDIDFYENMADRIYEQTIDVAELVEKFGQKKVRRNADRIRAMR